MKTNVSVNLTLDYSWYVFSDEDTVKNLVDKHHVRAENLDINQHQDYIVPLHGNGLLVPTGPYRAELKQKIVENLANKMKFSGKFILILVDCLVPIKFL